MIELNKRQLRIIRHSLRKLLLSIVKTNKLEAELIGETGEYVTLEKDIRDLEKIIHDDLLIPAIPKKGKVKK